MENLPQEEKGNGELESEVGKMNESQGEVSGTVETAGGSEVLAPVGAGAPAEYVFPDRLLSARELLSVSWRLLRPRLKKFFLVWILGTLMGAAAVFLCGALAVVLQSVPGIAAAILLFIILLVYLSLLLEIVGLRIAQDAEVGIREAFRAARAKVRPLFKATLASLALFLDLFLPLVAVGLLFGLVAVVASPLDINLGEAVMNIAGWLLGFFFLTWLFFLLPFTLLVSVWQQFLSFDVVLADRPVMAGAARAWALVRPRKRALLWRAAVFFLPYLIIIGILEGPAEESWLFAFVQQMLNFLFSFWLFMYFYSLYRNLGAMGAGVATEQDGRTVRRLIRWGAGVGVLMLLLPLGVILFSGAYRELVQPHSLPNECPAGSRCDWALVK